MRAALERGAGIALTIIGQDEIGGDRVVRPEAQRAANAALVLPVQIVLIDLALVLVGDVRIAGDVTDIASRYL
ncbi:hypothetical protein [Sphingomonas sp. Ant20]|uniref:hypothetical protein n=1 Tax=Sphingomonas sp. Ant20 TaxID=104605 RepID=UPI000A7392D8|nr:hypothetical protein [Sphingomonas sp. Ant20]